MGAQHATNLFWEWVDSDAAVVAKEGIQRNDASKCSKERDVLSEGVKVACDVESLLGSTLSTTLGETLGSTLNSALGSTHDSAAFGEALDLTLDEPLDVKLCEILSSNIDPTLGSPRDDHSTSSSPDITAPPTPRRLCGGTPSPNTWRDDIFEQRLSMAVDMVAQSRMQVSADCSHS